MTLRLNGDSSGFTEIKAADTAGDNSIKLPASNGSANQLLQNGGTAGELQYTSAGGGLHYDSSGRLLVGTSTARSVGSFAASGALLQIEGTNYQSSSASFINNQDETDGSYLLFGKSRGSALTSFTAVQNGDLLGSLWFNGADGNNFRQGARIVASVDGTPSTDVMPGKLVFETNGGSASPTPRMEIGSNGALRLLSGCPGIDFSAISATTLSNATTSNNLLDDYEEGYFTPHLDTTGTSGTMSINYSYQQGNYVKIGKTVFVTIDIRLSSFSRGTATGGFMVVGLPFTPVDTANYKRSNGLVNLYNWTYSATAGDIPMFSVYQNNNHPWVNLNVHRRGNTDADVSDPGNSSMVFFTAVYETAA